MHTSALLIVRSSMLTSPSITRTEIGEHIVDLTSSHLDAACQDCDDLKIASECSAMPSWLVQRLSHTRILSHFARVVGNQPWLPSARARNGRGKWITDVFGCEDVVYEKDHKLLRFNNTDLYARHVLRGEICQCLQSHEILI